MNERHLYDDEFETLLKEKADQFKMYPSDKVWNRVNSALHTRRRRFIAGMSVLIGGFLVVAGSQLIEPTLHKTTAAGTPKSTTPLKAQASNDLQESVPHGFVAGSVNASKNTHDSYAEMGSSAPFVLSSLVASSDIQSGTADILKSETAKIQATPHVNTILATTQAPVSKSAATLSDPSLKETETERANAKIVTTVAEEMAPEKSITHLSRNHNDRFSWGIYITPTLNTHYLTGLSAQTLRQSLQNSPIMVVRFANVNGFVDNTPAMGYNLGGNIMYKLSKNINVKAGIEFSYSRYYIKAYNANPTQNGSSLNPYLGYIPDSLINSNSGNGIVDGKNPPRYQNKYYQLSIPIGLEMHVAGKGKLQLHLGATIQPSYLLNTDSYVLSEDYNSYTKNPPVYRRWNLNAGAEAFVSYGVGKIRWELGPQVRYQIFSTYKNSYPFSENMLNYGIRIGFSKTIW